MSRLQNQLLLDSDKAARTLEEELQFVKYYLELELLRFENKLSYSIEVSEDVDKSIKVPNMLLHTFVENAIKHGIMHRGHGSLQIKIYPEKEGINIIVKDDGIGRAEAKRRRTYSTGKGLDIIAQQIEAYNHLNEKKIVLKITDLYSEDKIAAGTECCVYIPCNYSFVC